MPLPTSNTRRASSILHLCIGLLSWQISICNGRGSPGRPFFGGLRRPFRRSEEEPHRIKNEPAPRSFWGWRGGGDDYRYNQQQQQQQQQNNPYQQHPNQHQYQYPSQQQHQQQRQSQEGQPDLPPDLPGDGNSYQQQQPPHSPYMTQNPNQYPRQQGYPGDPSLPQYQQQQQQQQQPPYSQQHMQHQDPSLPSYDDDPMMNDVPDEPLPANAPWDDNEDENQPDFSAFDKEYIMRGLARLYRKKILPLEKSSGYAHFHSPPLSPADFDAPPAVLLLGPFSVGKTSFIKYLLGRDFPGIRVGPEPTTDRFTAVLLGNDDKIIPGAALCAQNFRPFTGLSPFGNNFLSRMEGVELDSPLLRNVTLIDTPGILSGAKQRNRNYDYEAVMKWFAERADLIIIMFDAHKLDISDEMKQVMHLMIPHLDKVRIVLNKADTISTQQLMRIYGALMWSLGKVMNTPEVCRVFMGSFWDKPLKHTEQADLLRQEEVDLMNDIMRLPEQAVMRRINELVKRARSVKVHAYIIHYLRKQMPYNPWAKKDKQKRLIGRLESEFLGCARRYGLPKGDFPSLEPFRQALYEIKDLTDYPKLDKSMVKDMEKVFSKEIPALLEQARHH